MIALVKNSASDAQLAQLVSWIERRGLRAHVSRGVDVTIVGLVGDTTRIDPLLLESMDLIERVQRVSEPFKLASRSFHPMDTVVDCGHGIRLGDEGIQVIVGLAATDEESLIDQARVAREAGATMLRIGPCGQLAHLPDASAAGIDLDSLGKIGDEVDLPVVCEVADARDVLPAVEAGIDVLRVSTHSAQNPRLLHEAGMTRTPILLEHGMGTTVDELLMAAEHIMGAGNPNVILCECGMRSYDPRMSFAFDVNTIAALQKLTHLPVVADPSHAAGQARLVAPAARAAVVAGVDGLVIDLLANDDQPRSDAIGSLPVKALAMIVRQAHQLRAAMDDEGEERS